MQRHTDGHVTTHMRTNTHNTCACQHAHIHTVGHADQSSAALIFGPSRLHLLFCHLLGSGHTSMTPAFMSTMGCSCHPQGSWALWWLLHQRAQGGGTARLQELWTEPPGCCPADSEADDTWGRGARNQESEKDLRQWPEP